MNHTGLVYSDFKFVHSCIQSCSQFLAFLQFSSLSIPSSGVTFTVFHSFMSVFSLFSCYTFCFTLRVSFCCVLLLVLLFLSSVMQFLCQPEEGKDSSFPTCPSVRIYSHLFPFPFVRVSVMLLLEALSECDKYYLKVDLFQKPSQTADLELRSVICTTLQAIVIPSTTQY